MKRLLLFILSIALLLPLSAQSKKKATASSKKVTTTKTTQKKATTTQKKTTTTQKKSTVAQKKSTAPKKTKAQLQKEQAAAQQARKKAQAKLAQLNKDVKASLDSVLILDNQIGKQQQFIDSLNREIRSLNAHIDTLNRELKTLQKELQTKKQRYAKAMVYMRKNRSVQNKLMFIFSADNFTQMVRRLRYMQEYSKFQKAQGELLKAKQQEVKEKQNELLAAKTQKEQNLHAVEEQKKALLDLRDKMLPNMQDVTRDHLRSGASNVSSSSGQHIGDAGSEAEVRDLTIRLLGKDREQLFEIDEALERIRRGFYGICEISLDPIPKKRLQARPFCRLTVKCQEEFEKKYGSYANYKAKNSDHVGFSGLQNDMESVFSLDESEE